ncbi:uncharacterized protein LOC133187820 [Saccostrea echinata]|uniref:uncharacterized protein LOC133187820 n=1 Tax=Saccostrea echinata TaxID=191078 RepID=UPI002A827701|nr:uncharacterized protein LOC133187820 [Saccostrea echinata]
MKNYFGIKEYFLFWCICNISAVKWPRGTYTLVKPKSGCPPGWLDGWRLQDNEDGSCNKNFVSPGHHFFGYFGKNMKFSYCTKDPNDINDEGFWPPGNYCILKHGISCPRGFLRGSIYWDDEDSGNDNSYGGTLPSGSYTRNTRIDYCCRKDGSFRREIQLPTTKPFYLLRFTSYCQMVKGMYVREEHVRFDDEDANNKNTVAGNYPYGAAGRNHDLFYCYYF